MKTSPHFLLLFITLAGLTSCTKESSSNNKTSSPSGVESYPIETSKLVGCRFKNANPIYAYQSTIEENTILCEEGVPKKVTLLTQAALPNGISFSDQKLALIGTAKERVASAPYEFYLENEAGYVIVKIIISVK